MSRIVGSTALITGGASGIGYLMGERLLTEGAARIVIWDIDASALERVTTELTARGCHVDGYCVDVTDSTQVQHALHTMQVRDVHVDLLINNAGIIVGRDFIAHDHDDIDRTMAINALAPMHLTRAILPVMLKRRRGHIVNIASAAGMVANPGMSVYCASKWAVTGWSESLRIELERSKSGVRVTTVMPYYIDTGMFAGVRSRVLPLLKPERAARDIVTAIRKDRILIRLPGLLNVVPLMRGALPARWFDRIAGEWLGVYDTMSSFTGRQK
ncbi:MAG TPA: SDR family oxidoreductase [Longimicrobiales bacterium]|nr:SDR family oxidoreductase [Longimicrobiales bacterium]